MMTDARIMWSLLDIHQRVGAYRVAWNGRDDAGQPVASGVYYYRLRVGPAGLTRPMVLIK